MDWDKLKIFHNVALDLNISEAANKMHISHSSISRQISSLEKDLKVTLFHRHARGLSLTEQGSILFKTAHDVFGKIALTKAQLTDSKENPSGSLKIASTVAFGTTWLAPRIDKFINAYPEIDVSIKIENKYTDLSMGEADVALRLKEPTQMDLVRFSLYEFQFKIYSSTEYIAKNGIPKNLEGSLHQPTPSTKSKGMGLGLFLSHSTINRFGGSLRLSNASDGGTITQINIPLSDSR